MAEQGTQNGSRIGLIAPLAVVVLALVLAACSPLRGFEAMQVANDIAAAGGPSGLKDSRPPPIRRGLAYSVEGRASTGDLYLPGDRIEAALVLVPGAALDGKDDPTFVAFAESLARARFAVLVPEIANLRQLKVRRAQDRRCGAPSGRLRAGGRGGQNRAG